MIGKSFNALLLAASAMCCYFAAVPHSVADVPAAQAPSVADGVYSEPQRRRGMAAYMKECSGCHGESLRGGESSPALIGADFRMRWNGRALSELFDKTRQMPPNDPGKLNAEQAADVVAAVLGANGFPVGSEELPTDPERLQQIHMVDAAQ